MGIVLKPWNRLRQEPTPCHPMPLPVQLRDRPVRPVLLAVLLTKAVVTATLFPASLRKTPRFRSAKRPAGYGRLGFRPRLDGRPRVPIATPILFPTDARAQRRPTEAGARTPTPELAREPSVVSIVVTLSRDSGAIVVVVLVTTSLHVCSVAPRNHTGHGRWSM